MKRSVVFVPGLLCTGELYAPQIAALDGAFACLVADHRGQDSMDGIAEHILSTAPGTFDLVGLSMGGYIAFEMAARAPERIGRLVLMDTSARPDRSDQTVSRHELIAMAEAEGLGPVMDRLLPLFVAESRLDDPELVAVIRRMADDTGLDAFRRQETAIMNRKDARADLAAIACPTLVVVGEKDRLTPPELAREIAEGIPGAELRIVPRSGHLTTLEEPVAVNTLLTEFLRR